MKTTEEYELAYREARAVLHRRGKIVGIRCADLNGLRYCRVDGRPLGDREIFREAWDDSLADELISEHFERHTLRLGSGVKTAISGLERLETAGLAEYVVD